MICYSMNSTVGFVSFIMCFRKGDGKREDDTNPSPDFIKYVKKVELFSE
jgi:hypothetical protein